jgi:hypothetical protein
MSIINGNNLSFNVKISEPVRLLYIYKNIILPVVLYGCETWSHLVKGRA